MMTTGALEDVTAEQLDSDYIERRVDDWVHRINALFSEVEQWLPQNWKARRAKSVRMDEELMRQYHVSSRELPILEITRDDGSQLKLAPRGLWIIGANGRIDMEGPKGSFVVVDTAEPFSPPSWIIAPRADRQSPRPFDCTAFMWAA